MPELLSWIQVQVDKNQAAGQFVLTGSHQFELMSAASQSLAGRTALLPLLPLPIAEMRQASLPGDTDRLLHAGGHPRIHAWGLDPATALGDYFETYLERDLRSLIALRNLNAIRRFVRLAAGRVGQILNPQTAVERAQRGTLGRVQLPFAGWQMLVYGGADHYLREGVEVVGLQFRTR